MRYGTAVSGTAAKPLAAKPVIYAPKGYGFVKDKGTMLVRARDRAQGIKLAILTELKRCGWPTKKLKVRQFGERFFVNIGHLRGLDPAVLFQVLKHLPNQCGHKAIFAKIDKLPEQVETDAMPVALDEAAA